MWSRVDVYVRVEAGSAGARGDGRGEKGGGGMASRGVGKSARFELRLEAGIKARLERLAKSHGQCLADFFRGLGLAELGRREAERRERKGVGRVVRGPGLMVSCGRGRKKGV